MCPLWDADGVRCRVCEAILEHPRIYQPARPNPLAASILHAGKCGSIHLGVKQLLRDEATAGVPDFSAPIPMAVRGGGGAGRLVVGPGFHPVGVSLLVATSGGTELLLGALQPLGA